MRSILVGYDGSDHAEEALLRARDLAAAFGAGVHVVSAAAPQPLPGDAAFGLAPVYDYGEPDSDAERAADERIWERHREHVETVMRPSGVTAELTGVVGDPAAAIVELAAKLEADLIVVGTREPGFVERLLGGSVSRDVARKAGCDVLIVHARDRSDPA